MEILKTKYSIDRKKEFQIKTVIFQENGVKVVKKEAYSKDSIHHIRKINKNYELFKGSKITLVEPTLKNNSVIFPFVTGESIDSILIKHVLNKDIEEFKKVLTWYKSFLTQEQQVPFYETKQFVEVFGSFPVLDGVASLKIANIDLNFDNLIIQDNIVTVIDYEWVFDFAVPLNYILYRAILSFEIKYHVYLKSLMSINDILEYLKIPKNEVEIYSEMEFSFISYVGRDISVYIENYLKSNTSIHEIAIKGNSKIIEELNMTINQISTWGKQLEKDIANRDSQIIALNKEINKVSEFIHKQQKDLEERDQLILEQNQKINEVSLWGKSLYEQVIERDKKIEELNRRMKKNWRTR